jgi:hypothetical protein
MAKNSVNNTVDLEIIQPGATIEKATIQGRMHNNQIQFYQTEKKIRSGSDLTSILQFIGALDDVHNSSITTAKGSGYHHAAFSGTVSSLFSYPNGTMGDTHIIGNVQKQGAGNEVHFPEFFVDAISPNWTSI